MTADRIVSRALWAARRLELPLPNMNTNACELLQCPIQANVPQTYRYILPISRVFPSVSSDATFSLSLSLSRSNEISERPGLPRSLLDSIASPSKDRTICFGIRIYL